MTIIHPSQNALDRLAKYGATIRDNRIVPIRRKKLLQMGDNAEASMQMVQGSRSYTFDANNLLCDGVSAIAAAGWAQVGGAQGIIDFGGNQGVTYALPSIANVATLTPQQARIDAVLVIYLSAITLTGSDIYKLWLVGSNNAGVAAANVSLGGLFFGEGASMDFPNGANTTAPGGVGAFPAGEIYEMPFANEQYGTKYEYASLYVAGTFGSITFSAFVAVLPRQ